MRIGYRLGDALPEFRHAIGEHGNAALALSPVAGRQVEENLAEAVLLQARGHDIRRMVIGADIFNALEAGAGGRIEAVEELVLAEEHRKIG